MTLKSISDPATIVALATPPGNAGVGIVRLSGPEALAVAKKMCNDRPTPEPRKATFINLKLKDITDTAIAIYFPAPNSFTGEDVVELQCHGGTLLLEKVIAAAISHGARMAQPGEFTRRALLNGKMSLDQAEALITMIHAESDAELSAASNFSTGEFAAKMKQIEQTLIEISARIEAALDHPEDVQLTINNEQLTIIVNEIESFTRNVATSNYIYNGIKVAILGKPNVGKSSLFNALLGHSRSIVTEIPGTTTDTVSETMQIDGYKIRFIDTAGIRESDNKIEKLGIERTLQAAHECDIAIIVGDDREIIDLVRDKPYIATSALCASGTTPSLRATPSEGRGEIENMKKQIIQKTVGALPKIQSRTIANARQLNELMLAKNALESALSPGQAQDLPLHHMSPDMLASDIQTALYHIGNITGTNATEAVLDEIFSRFCLGK